MPITAWLLLRAGQNGCGAGKDRHEIAVSHSPALVPGGNYREGASSDSWRVADFDAQQTLVGSRTPAVAPQPAVAL
jgi:hypothetical protein